VIPELRTRDPLLADGRRLAAVDDLRDGVAEVRTADHGVLAVGVADGVPFAVSNTCRHQFAKLGQGQVRKSCLECPWHRARYDVRSGEMVSGPKGRIFGFPPYSLAVRLFGSKVAPLRTFAVELRDGAIWLAG
jgi:3-phenylpropionate/trans-cinnamate dioxygenase ferredoxin component